MGAKKTTTQQTAQVTPNNPAWVQQPLQDYSAKVGALGNIDPRSFVAPTSALQTQAQTGAANLGGWQAGNQQAQGMATASGNARTAPIAASSLLTGLDSYMSPYTDRVVNSSLADFDHNAAVNKASLAAQGAKAGAFGGSRWGVQAATADDASARARASLDSGLRDTAFTRGADLSNLDAGRRQAADTSNQSATLADEARQLTAAGLLGDLSNSYSANQRSDIATQDALGGEQRAIDNAQRTAPISALEAQGALLGQGQQGLFAGSTTNSRGTTTTHDPMGQMAGLLGGLGSGISGLGAVGGVRGLRGLFL